MAQTIQERVAEIKRTSNNHEAMIGLLVAIGERQQNLLEKLEEGAKRTQDILDETRRDARQTQRLWVHLAEKFGLPDDSEDD